MKIEQLNKQNKIEINDEEGIEKVLEKIVEYDKIICVRATRPDADTYGASEGLAQIIRDNFPDKKVYTKDEKMPNSLKSFRSGNNKSVNQIVTRIKANGELIAYDMVCENCKEKFENDELIKCEKCGRLQNKMDFDLFSGKNICYCIRNNENLEEKELPSVPVPYESQTVFYERQINDLREQLSTAENTIEEEREAHEDFMKVSEEWSKRQKQELLDEIERLKKEVEKLEKQLEQANQQLSQIEVTPKGIKGFFKFGGKK